MQYLSLPSKHCHGREHAFDSALGISCVYLDLATDIRRTVHTIAAAAAAAAAAEVANDVS